MSKIYDCFTFYNEFDILELRLQEHWDHVDKFVIAEANTTHQGTLKNSYLNKIGIDLNPMLTKLSISK